MIRQIEKPSSVMRYPEITMWPHTMYALIVSFALVLTGVLFGCSSTPKVHLTTPTTTYDGQEFEAPRKLRNGSASLQKVYAWANSVLGTNCKSVLITNYPLETIHADISQDGSDDLFVTQPAWGGTGGNLYLAFKQTRKGYQFVGDIWFGGLKIVSPDKQGHPRIVISSWGGCCRCRTTLCILDRDGFHEIMSRNLPCGDGAYGHDQLHTLLFESNTVPEENLELVFGNPATIEFSGSIEAGKRFERAFGDRFTFVLEPIQYGWWICVYEKGRKDNLAGLTLPLHGPNPTDIEGWHFRNEDNTGPNDGRLNVPQEDREFIFSPEVGETINAPKSTNSITMEDIDRIDAFGQGELEITHMKLSPSRLHETASIQQMNFRCKLTWRRKNLEPTQTNTTSAP